MVGNISYDGAIDSSVALQGDTTGNTDSAHLLSDFLNGAADGVKTTVIDIFGRPRAIEKALIADSKEPVVSIDAKIADSDRLAATENTALANAFRKMIATLSVADLQASQSYQHFIHRFKEGGVQGSVNRSEQNIQPAMRRENVAAEPDGLPKIQEQLKKAGDLIKSGEVESGKIAFRQAIDMADKNYDATKTVQEIRQLQEMLKTGNFNGKQLTEDERMQVHAELLNRFAAAVLPYQLRSGSMLKDQAGYATVLRQTEQNSTAEAAYKDAIEKADALPIAEMKTQVQLIAEEMGRAYQNNEYTKFLTDFSQNLLGGKDADGNDVPGALKLPISARKDLIEFYVRPTMQADGSAMMGNPDKNGIPRFIADQSVVFKPEEADKLVDQVTAKYKEIYNFDLVQDPAKDVEFQVFRATIDNNLPEAIRQKREEKTYGFDSSLSNLAAMGVGLFGTAVLSKFGAGRLVAKALPGLFEEGAVAGQLNGLGKAAEFVTSAALASVTRNQMMTNVFDRKDETLAMSIANGFGSTFGARAFFSAPKLLADKVFLRGFTSEVATARAAEMVGPDGALQLSKLKELQPGLVIPKEITTFGQWSARVSESERATAIAKMADQLQPAGWADKLNLPNNILGQPFRAAETLSSSGINMRRMWAGGLAAGGVNTVMDAGSNYSRLWPKILSGEAYDDNGNKIMPTFADMVVKPIYKAPNDNSFMDGMMLGAFIAKPGSLLIKPFSALNPMANPSIGKKAWATLGMPITIVGRTVDALPRYMLSQPGPAVSEIGGAFTNSLKMQAWQVIPNYVGQDVVKIYDEQLQRNNEKLKDRKF